MTLAANPSTPQARHRLLADLLHRVRARLHRDDAAEEAPASAEDAVVRALCHDMRTPLASLEAVLGSLRGAGSAPGAAADPAELLELARAQTAHLSSMLRTAAATGGAISRGRGARALGDVVHVSATTSGLSPQQLTVRFHGGAEDVGVADARVQRILVNLLENAHRHGDGAPVRLAVTRRPGWVDLALTQAVARPERLISHLDTELPPPDLTGLGLWSVRRQSRELGGQVVWDVDGPALTLTVRLPDR
jgi:K+-sensing histidine kinase KdpD